MSKKILFASALSVAMAGSATVSAHARSAAQGGPSSGRERVLVVRTTEDPNIPSLPAGCPFDTPNVRLGATVWSFQTAAGDGAVVNDSARQLGTASACGKITTALVPFAQVPFYIEFTIEDGLVSAQGVCTVTSNDVPTAGLILAGCSLNITSAPEGFVGGSATSNSVFNPRGLPGFNTGSFWTLRLYRP